MKSSSGLWKNTWAPVVPLAGKILKCHVQKNSAILSLIALAFVLPLENILQFSNASLIDAGVVFLLCY